MNTTTRQERTEARRRSAARMAAAHAVAQAALAANRCPDCGSTVRRNLSLTGWVMCAQHGEPHFRLDPAGPHCGWNGFTE